MQLSIWVKIRIAFYVLARMLTSPRFAKFDPDDTEGYYPNHNAYNREMQKHHPIFFAPKLAAWVCSLNRDEVFAMAKDDTFSVRFSDWKFAPKPKADNDKDELDKILSNLLMSLPKGDHRRIRRLVQPAFLERNLADVSVMVGQVVEESLGKLSGEINLVQVTQHIPLVVMGRLVGISPDDFPKFKGLSDSIMATYSTSETDPKLALEGIEILKGIIASRQQNPNGDFISQLLQKSEEDGDALSLDEVMAFIGSLLAAGADTTRHFLNANTLVFLREQGTLQLLKDQPELVPDAVSEAARVNSFSHSGGVRFATQDTEIRGQKIKKGEMIKFNVNTANIDPEAFPEPSRFDMSRNNLKDVMIFGAGSHFCVGAALAKMIAYQFTEQFASLFPNARLMSEPVYEKDFIARSMVSLPVALNNT